MIFMALKSDYQLFKYFYTLEVQIAVIHGHHI
jgi:hypothetical protein